MKKIAFLYTGGRKNRMEAIAKKEAPEDFFYGALELRRRGHDIAIFEEDEFKDVKLSVTALLFGPFLRFLGLDSTMLAKLKAARGELNQFDVLVATTNAHGIALGLLKKMGKLSPKIIFLSMCPFFPEDNFLKKLLYGKILRQMFLAVENTHEIAFLKDLYKTAAPNMLFVPFGVDGDFWKPGKKTAERYVLSMGNDSTRDFETLVKAWQPSYPQLRIITRRNIEVPLPANAVLIQGDWNKQYLSDARIRQYIQESELMIIPTRESLRSSGPSVAMQSMACGKLVMITKTQGLWDEEVMRDGESCILLEPGSTESIQTNVARLLDDPMLLAHIEAQARPTMEKHYTVSRYADDLERILSQL